MYHFFDLSEYFETTQKAYYFLDGLFSSNSKLKTIILKQLNIPSSTYRTCRLKRNSNNEIYEDVIKYFGYNPLKKEYRTQYEVCLSKIYNAIYFNNESDLVILEQELNEYINHKNILHPIFMIFSLLIDIDRNKSIDIKHQENLDYLSLFRPNYYDDFDFLVNVLFYFNGKKIDELEMERLALKNNHTWLFYMIRGTLEYQKGNLMNAVNNYEINLKIFENSFNFERYISTSNEICCIYNQLEFYSRGINLSEKIIHYAFNQTIKHKWTPKIISNYLYSNFMLKRYQEILQLISMISLHNELLDLSSMAIILATYQNLNLSYYKFPDYLMECIKNNQDLEDLFVVVFSGKKLAKDSIFLQDNYLAKIIYRTKIEIK